MPRKTTILIVILAAITGILIFLAVRSDSTQQLITNTTNTDTATPTTQPAYAILGFTAPTLDASTGPTTKTVDVVIDTAGKPVAGVQIELSYDPTALSNVRVVPATTPFFGANAAVLINSVDATQGRVSYAAGISPDDTEKTGTGTVVRLSFTVNRAAGVANTPITFVTKSTVTTLASQGSVLKQTVPLQVILTASSPTGN